MKKLNVVAVLILVFSTCGFAVAQNSEPIPGEGKNGGFVDDSARVILRRTADGLSNMIQSYPEEAVIRAYFKQVFGEVPSQYNRQELVRIIKNVKFGEDEPPRFRDGRKLLFDYGTDSTTGEKYIIALANFFEAYTAWAEDQVTPQLILSLQEKMLHEASHHWGYDQKQGKLFGSTFPFLLQGPTITCDNTYADEHGLDRLRSIRIDKYFDPKKKRFVTSLFAQSDSYSSDSPDKNSDWRYKYLNLGSVNIDRDLRGQKQAAFTVAFYYRDSSDKNWKDWHDIKMGDGEFKLSMDPTFLKGRGELSSQLFSAPLQFKCSNVGLSNVHAKIEGKLWLTQ